jgi:hypothetical protein
LHAGQQLSLPSIFNIRHIRKTFLFALVKVQTNPEHRQPPKPELDLLSELLMIVSKHPRNLFISQKEYRPFVPDDLIVQVL